MIKQGSIYNPHSTSAEFQRCHWAVMLNGIIAKEPKPKHTRKPPKQQKTYIGIILRGALILNDSEGNEKNYEDEIG